MKKCPFCDANIEDSAHFCLYCMQSLTKKEQVILHQRKKVQWLLIIAAILVVSLTLAVVLSGTPTAPNNESPVKDPQLRSTLSLTPTEESTVPSGQLSEPVTVPSTQPPEPVTEPSTQPPEPVTEPSTQPPEPVTEPSTQPSEPVTEPSTQPSEPVTEPSTQPSEPVTEPSTQPSEPVTEPSTPDHYAKGTCGDNLQWILTLDGTLSITGTGAMYDYSYDTITTETNIPWYDYRKEITDISIGADVTRIGKWVFRDCSNLTSLVIPNGVTEIGGFAFWICTGLETVEIPETVHIIGPYAFYKCGALRQVTVPEGVTTLPDQAFYRCTALETVTLPRTLTAIGNSTFRGCSALENIYFTGTSEEWNSITVGTNNIPLTKATLHISQP